MTMRTTKKTGKMVAIMEVVDSDDLIVITDRGVLIRQAIAPIRTIGRVTQGVKLIQLDAKDKIASITRVLHEEDVDLPESPENGDELSSDENIGEASDNEVKT